LSGPNPRRPVALVTGGSRGIGAATALELADAGYDLAITYRNKAARAEEVAAALRERGAAALTIGADITVPAELARLFAIVQRWRSRLDALILDAHGLWLVVVIGDVIEGAITPRLLERISPDFAAKRRSHVGPVATTKDMARAIIAGVLDSALKSRATVVVGGALESFA
jgi:NAD(P)-dependent dehydrogenase (short-subunit alcohol dehydrogenase family)